MTKRPHEQECEMALETSKQSTLGESGPSENKDLGSDSEGSDFTMEYLSSDSDNVSIDSAPAEDDNAVPVSETAGTIDKSSWKVVHPPEPPIDMKSKFTVTNTGFCNVPKSKNPMDFFNMFFSEELFFKMAQNTNAYARYMIGMETKSKGVKPWHDVTLEEIKRFWGILINMGLSQRNNYKDFWSTHPVLEFPFFASVMTLERFESILSMFRLTSPSSNNSDVDPLVEVESLLFSLNSAFKHYCVPDQELRLDESLIFTSKQSHYTIQYVNKKYLVQGGIQQFEFCDPSSEYIIHIGLRKCRSGKKEKIDHTKEVIVDLLNEANLSGKFYHLFIRKAYMGLKLCQQLLSVNTFVTGPLDLTQYKDFPSSITRSQIKLESTLYARSGDYLLIKYNNQKPVCLTTGGWAEDQSTENAKCQQRVKPLIVRRYLRYISGKDKSYLHNTCTIDVDSCWKKIAFNLVDLALFNAFLLFKSQKDIKSSYYRQTFLEHIVEQLCPLRRLVVDPVNRVSLGPNLTRHPTSVNSTRNPSSAAKVPSKAANFSRNSPKVVKPVHKPDMGGGHKLTKVKVSTIQICRVCRKEGKAVKFICPVCNVYVHEKCWKNLKHNFNPQKVVQHSTPLPMPVQHVGSCISLKTSGIFEVTEIKVESDSD